MMETPDMKYGSLTLQDRETTWQKLEKKDF